VISLVDIPQSPPVAVSRSPMPWVLVQSLPVLVVEEESGDERYGHKWPISHKNREYLISEHRIEIKRSKEGSVQYTGIDKTVKSFSYLRLPGYATMYDSVASQAFGVTLASVI
jgi:hypothetical protein